MKILSVDDVTLIRRLVGKVVVTLGGVFLEASNGMEALEVLDKNAESIDLVLLDWNMPKMNGFELLKKIKNIDRFKHIPVVMVTTQNEKEKIIEAVQAGASNYLTKPFTERELAKKIFDCLGVDYEHELFSMFLSDALSESIAAKTGVELHLIQQDDPQEERKNRYGGQVIVLGKINAMVLLAMNEESAGRLVARMSGNTEGESLKIAGGISEVVNEVVLKAKALIEDMGLQCKLSNPFIIKGAFEEEINCVYDKISREYYADGIRVSLDVYYL